jgi:hypothetical protein
MNEHVTGLTSRDLAAYARYSASYDAEENEENLDRVTGALWRLLGDDWFQRKRQCVVKSDGRILKLELSRDQLTIKVSCGAAVWEAQMCPPSADGWGGYDDVIRVASPTGHTVKALLAQLLAFHALAEIGEASLLRSA